MLDYAPPPATRDSLPEETAQRRRFEAAFSRTAELYGFAEVSTPMFERADLFEARSGAEIKNSLLTFHCDHEEYALRPEMTAPICRMVASGALAGLAQPHRLFYIAPCFRYCRPHSGRKREFTQAGIEVLGDPSPGADAEVIATAHRFLRDLGATNLRLKVGTAGIFRALLPERLSADERAAVIGHLDRLAAIRERCAVARPGLLLQEQLAADRRALAALQAQDGYAGEFAIADSPVLEPEELVRRLPDEAAATYRRLWNVEGYVDEDTAELLLSASAIRGTLEEVSEQASAALAGSSAGSALDDLMSVCRLLSHYSVGSFEITLGIARGLTFYTGTVFEIASASKKLCGGGRYDRLVELFGGDPTPATGCAVRLDTLQELGLEGPAGDCPQGITVRAASARDEARAVRLAEELRARGVRIGRTGAPAASVSGDTVKLPDGAVVAAETETVLEALGADS